MSKYVRTEDGIMTVDDFVLCLLKKDAESYGKEILNFENTERMVDKYSTRNFYEFDIFTLIDTGQDIRRASRHCIMPECDALKEVEEWPNRKSDNIEELCDKFVCVGGDYRDIYTRVSDRSYNLKAFSVYGAIWTDKGLIYVAKMNEKGEFELL